MTDKQIKEKALEIFEECKERFWGDISERMKELIWPLKLGEDEETLVFQSIIEEIEDILFIRDSMDRE